MKIFLASLFLAAVFVLAFIKLTDRICDKPWSDDYKKTADYAAMQCPN